MEQPQSEASSREAVERFPPVTHHAVVAGGKDSTYTASSSLSSNTAEGPGSLSGLLLRKAASQGSEALMPTGGKMTERPQKTTNAMAALTR